MKPTLKLLTFLFVLVATISCDNRQKFSSETWQKNDFDWWMTEVRENLVDDLIKSDTLVGMSKIEVQGLLGEPDYNEEFEMKYLILEKYGMDIDSEYISNLKVEFGENRLVNQCEIEK